MSCVILNALSYIMGLILKYLEYNNDYIIARDHPSLLSMSFVGYINRWIH